MDSKALLDLTSAAAENNVPLDMVSKKPVLAELHTHRFNLDNCKCYLGRCVTYHSFFVREFLDIVSSVNTAMNSRCNAGTVTTNTRVWYGEFKVWINERGESWVISQEDYPH